MSAILLWAPGGGVDTRTDALTQSLSFDIVTSESPSFPNQITEHVVEVGSDVSDNVRVGLKMVSLEVFVSNEPIDNLEQWSGAGVPNTNATAQIPGPQQAAPPGSLTLKVPTWFTFPIGIPLLGAALSALGVNPTTTDVSAKAGLQPSPAQKYGLVFLNFDTPFDAAQQTADLLETLRTTAQLIEIVGTKGIYDNMVIDHYDMSRTSEDGTGAAFTIVLKEIRLVQTQTVAAPVTNTPRAQAATSLGNQSTKDLQDGGQSQSILSALASTLFGTTPPTTVEP